MTDIDLWEEFGPGHIKVMVLHRYAAALAAHAQQHYDGDQNQALDAVVQLGARVAMAADPRPPGPCKAHVEYQGTTRPFITRGSARSPTATLVDRWVNIVLRRLKRWGWVESPAVAMEFDWAHTTYPCTAELQHYWGEEMGTDVISRLLAFGFYTDSALRRGARIHMDTPSGVQTLTSADLG